MNLHLLGMFDNCCLLRERLKLVIWSGKQQRKEGEVGALRVASHLTRTRSSFEENSFSGVAGFLHLSCTAE